MKPIQTLFLAVTAMLPLLSACSTEQTTTAPVQSLPLVTTRFEELKNNTAPPTELERKLAALTQAERMTLAKALIATRDWGTWAEHGKLMELIMAGDAEYAVAINHHIVRRMHLPADAPPALREVVDLQLRCNEYDWPSIFGFIWTVTDDYLPQHPDDRRAWQFLSFMQYISDGEMDYVSSICEHIRIKGLDKYTEGQRILHREKHWHGCGAKDCPLCNE